MDFHPPPLFRKKSIWYTFLSAAGFILSPVSWWNDLVINIPLAWVLAFPFGWISESLLYPAMVGSYWFTNILGMILLHKGLLGFYNTNYGIPEPGISGIRGFFIRFRSDFFWSVVYTLLIAILMHFGWISFPDF